MTLSREESAVLAVVREKAREISKALGDPAFYRDKARELERSGERAGLSSAVAFARGVVRERGDALGHGFSHAESVALEAGAIVYAETGFGPGSDALADIALIAGYFHDIRRNERDHPEKAAREVGELMKGRMDGRSLEMALFSIRNHEAFKDARTVEDPEFMLCSGSLYDSDKFRWGPDNFVETIWNMAESMGMGVGAVMARYDKGIRGVIRIKDTFRTLTGKKYGPGFIEKGLRIGEELYDWYRRNGP